MSLDDLVRFRAPAKIKLRLEALAAAKGLDLSSYMRMKTIEMLAEIEAEEAQEKEKPPNKLSPRPVGVRPAIHLPKSA